MGSSIRGPEGCEMYCFIRGVRISGLGENGFGKCG